MCLSFFSHSEWGCWLQCQFCNYILGVFREWEACIFLVHAYIRIKGIHIHIWAQWGGSVNYSKIQNFWVPCCNWIRFLDCPPWEGDYWFFVTHGYVVTRRVDKKILMVLPHIHKASSGYSEISPGVGQSHMTRSSHELEMEVTCVSSGPDIELPVLRTLIAPCCCDLWLSRWWSLSPELRTTRSSLST